MDLAAVNWIFGPTTRKSNKMATRIGKRYTGEFNAGAVERLPNGKPVSERAVERGICFDLPCR